MHNRHQTWDGQPFSTVGQVADLLADLDRLVMDAAPGEGAEIPVVSVNYSDKSWNSLTVSDLRELAPSLEVEGASFLLSVATGGHPRVLAIQISVRDGNGKPWSNLVVEGIREVAVEGAFGSVSKRINAMYGQRTRETMAARQDPASEAFMRAGWWGDPNPWVLVIAGGIIAAVVGALIVALIVGG